KFNHETIIYLVAAIAFLGLTVTAAPALLGALTDSEINKCCVCTPASRGCTLFCCEFD
ncbi:hypothetical protein BGZ52_006580, partial [Haplosporangium bisporale]